MKGGYVLICALLAGCAASPKMQVYSLHKESESLRAKNDYPAAINLAKKAVDLAEQVYGPDQPDTADHLAYLAQLYRFQGNLNLAMPLLERALSIREKAFGRNDKIVAQSNMRLAEVASARGQHASAIENYGKALKIYDATSGPDTQVEGILQQLAQEYQMSGKFEQAMPIYERLLALDEQKQGSEYALRVSRDLEMLANANMRLEQYTKALLYYERAVMILEKQYGPDHPGSLIDQQMMAQIYLRQEMPARAEPILIRLIKSRETNLGAENQMTVGLLLQLGGLYVKQGQYALAEPILLRVMQNYQEKQVDHPTLIMLYRDLAKVYRGTQRQIEAEKLETRAAEMRAALMKRINTGQPVTR